MRRSSNGSSHAGFNNRPRQEEAGKWLWNWKMEGKSIQARRATQPSISLLASSSNLVPHPLRFNPSRPFLFVTLSLLEPPPSNARLTSTPSWSYLYLLYSAIPFLVSMRHVYLLMYLLVFRYVRFCSSIPPTFFLFFFCFLLPYQPTSSVRNMVDNFKASVSTIR